MVFGRLVTNLALFLFGINSAEASIKNCGNGQSPLHITDLKLIPDPPIRGNTFELILKCDNYGPKINNGLITTSLSLNFIPFSPSVTLLCDSINCPIEQGINDFSKSTIWPDTVSGVVSSKIVWEDDSGKELLCVQINTKVAATNKLRYETNFTQFDANLFADLLTYTKEPEAYNKDCNLVKFEK